MKPTVQTPRLLLVRQYGIVRFIIIRWFLKQMFHVAQSIVIICAMCLPTTWRGCLFPNNRWGVFVGRGRFCAKQFMFCRWFIWVISGPNQENPPNPQIPIGIVWERVGCVLGIEPNEHQIPCFQCKYSYHTDHSENTERPNSPNVLPMSGVMLGCGILRFCETLCFSGGSERTLGLEWESSELLWIRMVG